MDLPGLRGKAFCKDAPRETKRKIRPSERKTQRNAVDRSAPSIEVDFGVF
jgi:hypothetical protein